MGWKGIGFAATIVLLAGEAMAQPSRNIELACSGDYSTPDKDKRYQDLTLDGVFVRILDTTIEISGGFGFLEDAAYLITSESDANITFIGPVGNGTINRLTGRLAIGQIDESTGAPKFIYAATCGKPQPLF